MGSDRSAAIGIRPNAANRDTIIRRATAVGPAAGSCCPGRQLEQHRPRTGDVAGLIGLFVSWIPLIGIVGWILGPIAVTFGVLGLRRGKGEHKIMSWIGLVCGALTLLICLLWAIALFASFASDSGSS